MNSLLVDFSRILEDKQCNLKEINKRIVDDFNQFLQERNNTYINSFNSQISSYATSIQQSKVYLENIPFDDIDIWYKAVQTDKEKHAKEGHNFNIFNLLKDQFGFNIQETMHSRLIKFLLDKEETHGQGDLFLIELLKMLGVETPEIGNWYVTAETGRIDVLIERKHPQSIILIENKSNWAKDQLNQLYRYWYQAIFQKTNEYCKTFYERNTHKYQIHYLVPNTYKVLEEHSISKPKEYKGSIYRDLPEKIPMEILMPTFNEHVQSWLNNCLKVLPETNHRIREYIIQYQSLCNNL